MAVGTPRRTSVLVLVVGLVVTVAWSATLVAYSGLSLEEVVLPALTGSIASAACLGASWWQGRAHRARGEDLERARHRAVTDPLTGLLNRAGLLAELEQAVIESRRTRTAVGVLFLDLDRFKMVNDSMGHDAGDELLRVVAARLLHTVRSTDLVARFGGDEFVVVCRGLLSGASVPHVARQILAAFREPATLRGSSHTIGTSIGIAVAEPGVVADPEVLLRDADTAMYRAKRERLGYAVFDEVERLRVVDRLDTERDLVIALDDGQLAVYFQPIVALPDCRVVAFEALIRWNHPRRGLLGPDAFLPVAEEAGLMARLGDLVLREACAQKAVWNHLNPCAHDLRVSVNVAEQQLLDPTFAERVTAILDWAGLPPAQLTLEITEGIIASHLGDLEVLHRLRALGVTFAIDDFGTGQSSLATIRKLDMVSVLKIDKGFVSGLHRGATDGAIIEAVVSMAGALGLRTVAEGVEDVDQLQILRDLGVDMLQGYLFNRPLAAQHIQPGNWLQPVGIEVPAGPTAMAAVPQRDGVPGLQISRSLMEEPRSRSAPRPLRPGKAPGPGTSGPA